MNLTLSTEIASSYKSNSQIARVLTETWAAENMYCPICGAEHITHLKNNLKVADFLCKNCGREFELKGAEGKIKNSIVDGDYNAMIERITSNRNPDFFFMSFSTADNIFTVRDLLIVPRHFFAPDIIKRRNRLSQNARRKNWGGCTILAGLIPQQGKIPIVTDGNELPKSTVLSRTYQSDALAVSNIDARGWLLDVLMCLNFIDKDDFTLPDIYSFADKLRQKHPENRNIEAKIRQQLQILRDRGIIEFTERGKYRKISPDAACENTGGHKWLDDTRYLVEKMTSFEFCLDDFRASESYLKNLHPDNNNIIAKVRQQLQILRDKGELQFLGGGRYRKLKI